MKKTKQERDEKSARDRISNIFETVVSVKEVVEVMEKKTTRNWTAEETNLFCSSLLDPVTTFMLTLERKALKKAATKRYLRQFYRN